MTVWILDDGCLGHLASSVTPQETRGWPKDRFWVARQTATDATEGRKTLLETDDSPFATLEIPLESETARVLYTHLRACGGGTANLAEYQAMAWAMTESADAVLVTEDKRAALTALAELGCGRVAHPFELWLHLEHGGLITTDQLRSLSESTRRKDQGLPGIALRVLQHLSSKR